MPPDSLFIHAGRHFAAHMQRKTRAAPHAAKYSRLNQRAIIKTHRNPRPSIPPEPSEHATRTGAKTPPPPNTSKRPLHRKPLPFLSAEHAKNEKARVEKQAHTSPRDNPIVLIMLLTVENSVISRIRNQARIIPGAPACEISANRPALRPSSVETMPPALKTPHPLPWKTAGPHRATR